MMAHRFIKRNCLVCGKESVTFDKICSLCRYKQQIQKKLKRVTVYCCSYCGMMIDKKYADDIFSAKIIEHVSIQHNDDFNKKIVSTFTKQHQDYEKNPAFPDLE